MQQQASSPQTLRLQIIAALFAVYFFWGGTYLAMKVAIETIPPFLMGGLRFFTAGALVYLLSRLLRTGCQFFTGCRQLV